MELSFQKQTKLHNPEKGIFGNCMVTCYANYLNIPVESCPAFEELFSCKKPEGFWWQVVELWWKHKGYTVNYVVDVNDVPADVLKGICFVTGKSPRNSAVNHMVIYKNGQLYFDPHPDNTGIIKGTECEYEWVTKNNL